MRISIEIKVLLLFSFFEETQISTEIASTCCVRFVSSLPDVFGNKGWAYKHFKNRTMEPRPAPPPLVSSLHHV